MSTVSSIALQRLMICESLTGRSNLEAWRELIMEIVAGNSESKASMVDDPQVKGMISFCASWL